MRARGRGGGRSHVATRRWSAYQLVAPYRAWVADADEWEECVPLAARSELQRCELRPLVSSVPWGVVCVNVTRVDSNRRRQASCVCESPMPQGALHRCSATSSSMR